MLTVLILDLIYIIVSLISSVIPQVTLNQIPFFGETIRSTLVTMMGYWNSLIDTLPYLQVLWNSLIYIVLPFEMGLIVMKLLLGNRTPTNDDK